MVPANLRFGGGSADTLLSPWVAVYLLIAIVLIFILPRGKAITPFLFAFFTIPIGEVVVLGGFHFTALRLLILAGLARRASSFGSRSNKYGGGFSSLDSVVILWSISAVVVFCLEFLQTQALINGLGTLLDTLGGYLVVRYLIPDGDAMRQTIKALAAVCVVNGVLMIGEQFTSVNVFSFFGGPPLTIRDGHIRSGGVMGCIPAGAFAGVLVPLFVWLWIEGKSRMAACAGLVGATAMMAASYSSTSWMAYGASILGLAFWPLRKQMRLIRWGIASVLIGLHMVMKAPVWALIARVDLTGSSSGDQRYQLVNMCIQHFWDWWLLGYKDYASWGWDSWDLVNQFVAVALTGGLITLVLYIAIFTRSFGSLGTARKLVEGNRKQEWLLWCLGSALFAHIVAHFGINYMAQLIMGLLPLVACISVATSEARQAALQNAGAPAQEQLAEPVLGMARSYLRLGESSRREGKAWTNPYLQPRPLKRSSDV